MDPPSSPSIESVSSVSSTLAEELKVDPSSQMDNRPVDTVPNEFEEDPKFYFRDSNVKLVVGKRVYNIPRAPLERHSAFFRGLFAASPDADLPPGWAQQQLVVAGQTITVYVHGTNNTVQTTRPSVTGLHSDTYPLYDLSAREFGVFLSVLYPDNYNTLDLTTTEEWRIVLKLSTRWQFGTVRDLALRHLDFLLRDAPLERLAISRAHDIDSWTKDALHQLVYRAHPLDSKELARLQWEDIAAITKQREQVSSIRNLDVVSSSRVAAQLPARMDQLRSAVCVISKAYRRTVQSRRNPVASRATKALATQVTAFFTQDNKMTWESSHSLYRLVFRGPLPHALACLDRLLSTALADRNRIKNKARFARQEELEQIAHEQCKNNAHIEELLALKKKLEPTSALHHARSLDQLRPHVARLCQLVSERVQSSNTPQLNRDIAYRGIVL